MSILLGAAMAAAMMAPGQGPTDVQQRVAPRGSYAQSCTGAYVNQGRLYADCRDQRGQPRGTSIELARCSSAEIANDTACWSAAMCAEAMRTAVQAIRARRVALTGRTVPATAGAAAGRRSPSMRIPTTAAVP